MPAPFIAMMPQWDFLDFLRIEAERFAGFGLRMNAAVTEFVVVDDRIAGVRLNNGEEVRARRLVLACDGRDSIARRVLPCETLGAPIDVLWFAVPKTRADTALRASVAGNRMIVMIDRGDYWQCAFVIAKGGTERLRARGIEAFRADVGAAAPDLGDLAWALPDWDSVRLLSVALDRLTRWSRPGLLAIGDAAHAMSPVGGIGINLAIQDAVATANLLAAPLARGASVDPLLPYLQKRRLWPTRVIQGAQRVVHENLLQRVIAGTSDLPDQPPLPLRLLDRYPVLRRIPGSFIGHGLRQEHVRSPLADTYR
jgi:2-polyprenyl-6-methoxyphenol hydroxylase-like FAD-dependent oxidoreductase